MFQSRTLLPDFLLQKIENSNNVNINAISNHENDETFYNLINDYRITEVINKFKKGDTTKLPLCLLPMTAVSSPKPVFIRYLNKKQVYLH